MNLWICCSVNLSYPYSRHGLQLSNRDLLALEHLPEKETERLTGVGIKDVGRRGNGREGYIPYVVFLTRCLMSAR